MEAWISYHNQKMAVMFDFCFNNYKYVHGLSRGLPPLDSLLQALALCPSAGIQGRSL